MDHPLQISHQVSVTTSLLPDGYASPNGNTSPTTPKNERINPLIPDDDPQDDSDTPFDYDLVLPPPNPLPKRAPPTREPTQIFFEYPLQKAPKFSGKEALDALPGQESTDTYKNNAKVYSERIKEAILAQGDDSEENREYKRLCDFFADEEKIVYRRRPQAEGEEFNQTLYDIKTQPKRTMEDSEIGSETIWEENMQTPLKGNVLRFESRFESGNLSMASMVSENEYNLILQSDINTYGFGQWFFFAVMNNKKNQTVKFNILNYRKTVSLHNLGMRVLVYSTKEAKKSDIGWSRTSKAEYFCNNIPRENFRFNNSYRTLSFEYTFKNNSDCVYFAYSMPYTYSNLQDYLDSIEMDEIKSRYFGRSTLCRTLAGNKCELVTITQKTKSMDCDKKKCVFLTARVHPGETNSSFVIQGVMDFLLSNSKEAESLREKFIFKIIPMLNPDGVIHGNSRCCLIGSDLNRKWKTPSPKLHPTIYNAKVLASELHQKYGVILYCDFHGHSKKRDTFMYGCQEGNFPMEVREFAFVLGKVSPLFSYRKSSFFMESSKLGTARIALYQEFKIKCSYTLEASFFGPEKTGKPYSIEELIDFGGKFCKAILLQFSRECVANKKSPVKEIDQELAEAKRKMIEELYSNQENLMNNEPDSGSESELSEDELPRTVINDFLPKTKKRPPILKKQPSRTPQKLVKSSLAPFSSVPAGSVGQTPTSVSLAQAKMLKLSLERATPLRERYFPKVAEFKKTERYASVPREAVYVTSPGPEGYQNKAPETLENFCFVVRKLESKFDSKNETRRQMINTHQEGFQTPDIKSAYESLVIPEKRAEKEKEKEEKLDRLSKDKRRAGNLVETKRSGNLSVANTIKRSFPSLIGRGTPVNFSTLKNVRSLKEVKSVRDFRLFENREEGDNIEDIYPNRNDEIKDMMHNIKDILDSNIGNNTAKETREIKDIRDMKDFKELRDIKAIIPARESKEPQSREISEVQSRPKIKKSRLPYTLEPLGKGTIVNSFEKLDTDPRFKTNTKIKHPGFQRRSEEDGTILRESLKEYSREAQRPSMSSIKELLNFGGLDRWKSNVLMAEEQNRESLKSLNGIGSPKKTNAQEKDTIGDELQMSIEYVSSNRRIKKMEGIGRMNSTFERRGSRKQVINATARTIDMRTPNTLSKVDLSAVQSVHRHKSPLKG